MEIRGSVITRNIGAVLHQPWKETSSFAQTLVTSVVQAEALILEVLALEVVPVL